jgi:SRSO17 transposase
MSEDRLERFDAYVEALAKVIGHADRTAPLRDYCRGLLLPGERKSVEPIAAVTAPARCCILLPTRRGRTSGFSAGYRH